MAYIPDKLGERRRAEGVSQTAREFFEKYCEHVDQDTGRTLANVKTCAKAFGMRSDNAQKYDSELVEKGWIEIVIIDGRTYREMKAGWIPVGQRKSLQTVKKEFQAKLQNLKTESKRILNLRKSSYILGEVPKFKESLLNFRKLYKEYIDQPIDQLLDQLFDQIESARHAATQKNSENVSDSAEETPNSIPGANADQTDEPVCRLPENFEITQPMREWARQHTPDVDLELHTLEFKNYWGIRATRNNRRTLDQWRATWESQAITLQRKANENKRQTEVWREQKDKENQRNGSGNKPSNADTYEAYGYHNG